MATDGMVDRWDGVAYLASDERRMASVDQMPGAVADVFSARPGRRVNGSGLVASVSSTGNGSVSVTAGSCRIYDGNYASQGGWDVAFANAVGPIALGARPPAGQSRYVLVVARLYDSDIPVGAVKEAKIELVAGGAGTTPSVPGVNALSLVLATLTVPASGAISVTQSTRRTVAAGGVLPVATTAERTQLVTDGIAYPGLTIFNEQTKREEVYGGTGWVAQSQEVDSTSGSPFWGAAYAADTHQYKMHSQTVVGTPNVNGNILVADLSTFFAGVGAATATLADSSATQSRGVFCDVAVNLLYVRLFTSAGAFVTSSVGAERVNVIIHGWV